MYRKLTDKEIYRIRQMDDIGFTHSEISKMMNIPEGSVGYYIRKTEKASVKAKKHLEEKVITLKKRGASLEETAQQCDISDKKVQRILDKKTGSHRYVNTAYPAITKWMNSRGLLKKDIMAMTSTYNSNKPVSYILVNQLLSGQFSYTELQAYGEKSPARTAIIQCLMQESGMSFSALFKEKIPFLNEKNRSSIAFKNCKYKALDDWLKSENISIQYLATKADVSYQTVKNLLSGTTILTAETMSSSSSRSTTIRTIKTILEYSGLSYRKAFAELFE